MNKLLLFVLCLSVFTLNPVVTYAKRDSRSRLVKGSVVDIRKSRIAHQRPKPKKFIYSADTNEIKSVKYGQMLPSQVTVSRSSHKSGKDGERVKLRSIASMPSP